MRSNTLKTYTNKPTRNTILDTVNKTKDRQALAILQEIREAQYESDGMILL